MLGKDADVKSNGGYATGCVRIIRNVEAVASYEYLNRDVVAEDNAIKLYGWFTILVLSEVSSSGSIHSFESET